MPTYNRRAFVRAAIFAWSRQTYEERELVILDDGEDKILDLVPADPRIKYLFETTRRRTGDKRNRAVELCMGEVICHFDDDDYSSPTRIADQVERLEASGRPVTGYHTLLFWDTLALEARRYRSQVAGYVCGTSLAYLRAFWEIHKFPDKQEASDNAFVYPILRQIAPADGSAQLVARIHASHTSSKAGICERVSRETLPPLFWINEDFRLLG
jgi:glycosyltransferase involved in cell wall biosynthesis